MVFTLVLGLLGPVFLADLAGLAGPPGLPGRFFDFDNMHLMFRFRTGLAGIFKRILL